MLKCLLQVSNKIGIICGRIAGNIFTLKFAAYWSGASNTIWTNPLQWSCSIAPVANTDAFINTVLVMVIASATCRILFVVPTIPFTVNAVANFTIVK
jgi:hypothetical protein